MAVKKQPLVPDSKLAREMTDLAAACVRELAKRGMEKEDVTRLKYAAEVALKIVMVTAGEIPETGFEMPKAEAPSIDTIPSFS